MHVNAMCPDFSKRPAHRLRSTRRPSDAVARHDTSAGTSWKHWIFPRLRWGKDVLHAAVQHWRPRIGDAYLEDSLPDIALAAWRSESRNFFVLWGEDFEWLCASTNWLATLCNILQAHAPPFRSTLPACGMSFGQTGTLSSKSSEEWFEKAQGELDQELRRSQACFAMLCWLLPSW